MNDPALVPDASVAAKWFLPDEELRAGALGLLSDIGASAVAAVVPPHFHVEIANVLWVAVRRNRLTAAAALWACGQLDGLELEVHTPDNVRVERSALTAGISPYDAAYLEVARHLDAVLWTADQDQLRAALELGVPARWLGEYPAATR
ncbi:MAG: type II toxin-antitoxin system VapC family toxin [Myxococcota bacterium]